VIRLFRRWLDDRRARKIVEDQKRQLREMMSRLAWEGYMEAETREEVAYWLGEIRKHKL
jgi:hypothetical protein